MEYKGRLYGKVHQTYFETGKTSDDYDNLEKQVEELEGDKEKMQDEIDSLNATIEKMAEIFELRKEEAYNRGYVDCAKRFDATILPTPNN